MKLNREQLLTELNRQLEKICALDRIDRQTIRHLQVRIQELASIYPPDPSIPRIPTTEWPSNNEGGIPTDAI
jgi:hypothetical protein